MPVSYDNKKIIPAPLWTISKQYQIAEGGERLGSIFDITLQGTLIAYKGSPRANLSGLPQGGGWDNDFWVVSDYPVDEVIPHDTRLAAISRKQERLRQLFVNEGRSLEAITPDGTSPPIKCNPRVIGIDFTEGIWVDRCEYRVQLQADVLHAGAAVVEDGDVPFVAKISSADESIQIEEAESPGTFRVTRTLRATGKRHYDEAGDLTMPAWQQARKYVVEILQLGFTSAFVYNSSGVNLSASEYSPYNRAIAETIDEKAGSYAITETFLMASGNVAATEDYRITDRVDNTGRRSIITEGTIQGLYTGLHNYGQKIQNAENYWAYVKGNLVSRIQLYVGATINQIPLNYSVTRNPVIGTIEYTYEYDNRPTPCIEGAITETIEVSDTHPGQVIAIIPIIGRPHGPLLQNMSTYTERRRDIRISALMGPASGVCDLAAQLARKPDTDDILEELKPTGYYVDGNVPEGRVYKVNDKEDFGLTEGNYTRTVTYVWEKA